MQLLFFPERLKLHYAIFTPDSEIIMAGSLPVKEWSTRQLDQLFKHELAQQLRLQGKVFSRLGIVIPFHLDPNEKIQKASPVYFKLASRSSVQQGALLPSQILYEYTKRLWPHLEAYFLFDTALSARLERHVTMAPFSYDVVKQLKITPYVHGSYAHQTNLSELKPSETVLSLWCGDTTSALLATHTTIIDIIPSYSVLGSIMGGTSAGALDPGFVSDLLEAKKLNGALSLLNHQSGLFGMIDHTAPFDQLLEIAGLIPRQSLTHIDSLEIETIEWMELSLRAYIKALRHAIGALLTSDAEVKKIIVSSSFIGQSSPFWKLLTAGTLSHLKLTYAKNHFLTAASQRLADPHG